jgi:serine/threonine protein kinase/Tfp pilus assembly protein PilF
MGLVFKAEDLHLRRLVAIKFLSADLLGDPDHRARFLREARMASALSHPHICVIHEIGEEDGNPYIAMEYVAGRSLKDDLSSGPWPAADVVRYGLQIAGALQHAHEKGIVHRDLKCANVMITPEAGIKILDFGLAKRLDGGEIGESVRARSSITEAGTFIGTMHYAAPEVFRGEPADARSDIWSLGVVLYEMSAGKLPFDAPTGFELSSIVLRDAPPPLPSTILDPLRAVIARCLDKDRGKRYQSAGEIRADLEPFVSAAGPALPPPAAKSKRFRRNIVLAAAAVIVISAGIWIFSSKSEHRSAVQPAGATLSTRGRASRIPEANEYFEKAMLFLGHQFDLPRGRGFLEKALDIDPGFAEARAWYGFAFLLEIDSGFSNDSSFLYKTEEELRRALKDDPNTARAHASLAALYFFQGQKELMRQEVEKAKAIDPLDLDTQNWLGNSYLASGDLVSAKALYLKLLEQDPLFFPARMTLAEILSLEGDPDGAVRELEKLLEQDPRNSYAIQKIARVFIGKNDLPQARLRLEGLPETGRRNFDVRLTWAILLALEGKTAEARTTMDEECLKYAALAPWSTLSAAEFFALVGEPLKALDWLEKAVRNGDERAEWFRRDRLLASLRDLPRFKQIEDSIAYRRAQREKK